MTVDTDELEMFAAVPSTDERKEKAEVVATCPLTLNN